MGPSKDHVPKLVVKWCLIETVSNMEIHDIGILVISILGKLCNKYLLKTRYVSGTMVGPVGHGELDTIPALMELIA